MQLKFLKKECKKNTLTVYATRLEDLNPYIVNDGLEQMPASWIRRILKYKKLSDRNLAFATYALIYYYCITNNIDPALVLWKENNVPTILNKDLYISLSHSHKMAVLVVDTAPVGVDVEYILNDAMIIKDEYLNRLSPEQNLKIKYSNNPEREFYIQWSIKEAQAKYKSNQIALSKSWSRLEQYTFNLEVQQSYVMTVLSVNNHDEVILKDVHLAKCFPSPSEHNNFLKKHTLI